LLPPDVCGLESNPAALQTRILTHITDEVTTLQKMFPGLIEEWDVVNEPVEQHDLMDVLGGEWAVASWLNATAVANPAAGRRLNDNGVCSAGAVGGGQE
jgi:GH35 family endo-1,4-beta-xylanase